MTRAILSTTLIVTALLVFAVPAWMAFDRPTAEAVLVTYDQQEIEAVPVGKEITFPITIDNRSSHQIRLVGLNWC